MNSKKNNRRSLFYSVISLLLCVSMLLGTTLAWFSDSVSSTGNIIKTGRLKVEMHYADSLTGEWKDASEATIFNGNLWEPGYSDMKFIKVSNTGNLAFSYQMHILPAVQAVAGQANLADVIDVYIGAVGDDFVEPTAFSPDMPGLSRQGTLTEVMAREPMTGVLLPADGGRGTLPEGVYADTGDVTYCVILHMQETAGNEYQDLDFGNNFTIQLVAAQYGYELDNFGGNYDADATYPDLKFPEMMDMDMGSAEITVDSENKLTAPVTLKGAVISATVPAGVLVEEGITELTLIVEEMDETTSNITLGEGEEMRSLDVHVAGVSAENTVPMIISLGAVAPEYLNQGNLNLAHVENGVTVPMTRVEDLAALDAHNEYYYDVLTGELTVAMATFSEVAVVAEEPKWEGNFDYSWYNPNARTADYTIANADQLAAFGAIVGGMDGKTADSFAGKTVKLLADIDLGDKESENNPKLIFYPIGYYNSEGTYERTNKAITSGLRNFEGTFDGNGHTISNFYHNTWEMKGDHDWYTPEEQYYRDGMGLFGRVYGGTIKNLTVRNFKSDGEIATTGVIAAYADGATFENIAIFDCNPRVYNIGNGGIVGCVGWYAKEANLKTTFKNITVDNSNKISALWGSYDVACGGLVGQYYPTSGQTSAGTPKNAGIHMENCHVSAIMDVYNDVCGNYQYYAYRYAGMLIGSVRENETIDGKVYPKTDGITASGCTVNYGDWNDYYYCEFEKNGHPSYSGPDDYKFSRIPHSELNFTDSNGNGLVDANERASVTGCKHNHTDAEDNQAIYLPFVDQLFTGYGWGVTSKGIKDFEGIETIDVSEGDQEESVEKFAVALSADTTLKANEPISLSELFNAIEGAEINSSAVQVSVTALNDSGIVGTYVAGTDDWTQGTLTFNKLDGMCIVTIQDYNFCKPTSFMLKDGKLYSYPKFATLFTGNFLYRVGNTNPVALSSLFEEVNGSPVGNITVSVENVAGSASGVHTSAAKWSDGKIQFSGTGVVKVTIEDEDIGGIPVVLNLEVVNAKNVTTYGEMVSTSCVMLNDITMSDNGKYSLYDNQTLYGNGFTFNVAKGRDHDTAGGYVGGNGTVWVRNSTLDNVTIVGEVYTKYGGTVTSEYNFPTVLVLGNSTIANCYISNGSSPVRVGSGCNLEVINSTLEGGIFANLDIRGGKVKLQNVTTINQTNADGSSANSDGGSVGLGIVVHSGSTVRIDIDGLTQYNCISKNVKFTSTDASALKNAVFGENYRQFQFTYQNTTWANTGIVSMVEEVKGENFSVLNGYTGQDAEIAGYNGYVYAPTGLTSVKTPNAYATAGQYAIAPDYKFDYTTKNNVPQENGKNDYCVYDQTTQKYLVSFDDGESFVWDASILSVTKEGQSLNYTVSVTEGAELNADNTITFDTAGDYTVTYRYTDDLNYKLSNGKIATYSKDYEKKVKITVYEVVDTSVKTEFAFGTNGFRTETANNLTYVMPDVNTTVDSHTAGIGVTTVGGVNIYYPIVSMHKSGSSSWYNYFSVFEAVTITDLDGTEHSTSNTTLPSGLTVVGGFILDANGKVSSAETANGTAIFNYSTGKEIKCATYSSYGLCYYPDSQFTKTGTSDRAEQTIVVKYRYTDSNGTPYYYYVGYWCEKHTKTTCVTSDTLITLADGTQKRIDALNGNEELLVWNHITGKLESAPIAYIVDHGKEVGEEEVIHLYFSDGTNVKIIGEHVFYDADQNKYITLDANAEEFIGHSFVTSPTADGTLKTAELVAVEKKIMETGVYEVVTYQHLTCFTDGILSASAYMDKLLNIFDVNEETMAYAAEDMQKDIETYGLYTYADFEGLISEEAFELYNAAYLKIAVGKGNITWADILALIDIFFAVDVRPLQ